MQEAGVASDGRAKGRLQQLQHPPGSPGSSDGSGSGNRSPMVRYTSGVYGGVSAEVSNVHEVASALSRAVTGQEVARDAKENWEQLFNRCMPNLWLYLYIPFLISFALLWLVSRSAASLLKIETRSTADGPTVALGRTRFIHILAAAIFGIGIFVQLAGVALQISSKKRILNSFVAYITMVTCTVYLAKASSFFPDFKALDGQSTQFLRYYAWANTTPMMITVIAALGGSLQEKLIPDWGLLRKTLIWDFVMLIFGLAHTYTQGAMPFTSSFFQSCAVICLGNVFYNIHLMTNISVANAGTSHEIRSLRGVQYLTYIFWLLFPLVNGLHQLGYLDVVQHEICMVVVDVLAKNVYSVTLLSGNFCVLDMVATIRIAQIKSEAGSKRTSVVNAEAVKKALQMAVMEAETSARLSRRFLANISHELRTPLNSVIAFNSLLLEAEDLNSVHRDYVRSSFTSAEALLGIINQVLEYARLGAGQPERGDKHLQGLVELDSAPFSVQLLCDDLCDILGARAASRMVDFSINCPELWGPPANVTWLYGDGFRVRQVIIILCDNGLKFAKKLGGKASVDILMDPWENDPQFVRLLVKVSDNGVGISPEKQNKLFKPFSQVHDSYESGKQEGTGLGLAICQKIVRSMGGSVTVSSDGNGQGSIFSVEVLMPRVDPPAGTVQLTSQKTLDGKVHLLLPDGPTRQVLTKACVSFGLSVEGNALPDELGDDFSPATIAHALALMEQQQRAQTDGGVAQVGEVFVVGAKLFMQLHDRSPTLVASAPIVCLSFLSQLPELRQRKGISMDRVQLTPVKVAGLRAKIDMLLTQAASVSADDSTPASTRPTASALGQISIPRVLVTDDQSVNQKVAVAMLRKILGKDLEVAVANNGKEGLDAAIAGGLDGPLRYDMILMDVQMPFMDGLEATRKIREWEAKRSDGQSYFIVAMTAHASQSDIDECLNSGMNRYTSKPVNMSIFRTVLEEYKTWKKTRK